MHLKFVLSVVLCGHALLLDQHLGHDNSRDTVSLQAMNETSFVAA
jgi:hypothetical protein